MKFKVKLTYPTVVRIGKQEYTLFPGKEIDLPKDNERVKNLVGMGYIEPVDKKKYGGK